jgi:hypothetical protein
MQKQEQTMISRIPDIEYVTKAVKLYNNKKKNGMKLVDKKKKNY